MQPWMSGSIMKYWVREHILADLAETDAFQQGASYSCLFYYKTFKKFMLHGSCSPRNSLKTFQDLGLLMMQHHGAAHNLLVHRLLQEVVDPFLVSNSPHRWSAVARRRWSFAQGSGSTTVSQGPLVLQAVAQGARADRLWSTTMCVGTNKYP